MQTYQLMVKGGVVRAIREAVARGFSDITFIRSLPSKTVIMSARHADPDVVCRWYAINEERPGRECPRGTLLYFARAR